jgi:site-specific recombinase XerD
VSKAVAAGYTAALARRGLARSTSAFALAHIGALFQWAEDRGHVEKNHFFRISRTLPRPKRGQPEPRAFAPGELRRLLAADPTQHCMGAPLLMDAAKALL